MFFFPLSAEPRQSVGSRNWEIQPQKSDDEHLLLTDHEIERFARSNFASKVHVTITTQHSIFLCLYTTIPTRVVCPRSRLFSTAPYHHHLPVIHQTTTSHHHQPPTTIANAHVLVPFLITANTDSGGACTSAFYCSYRLQTFPPSLSLLSCWRVEKKSFPEP